MEDKCVKRMDRLHLLLEDNNYDFKVINHDRLGVGFVIPFSFKINLFVNEKVVVESKNNKILMNTEKERDYIKLKKELSNLFNVHQHNELKKDVEDFVNLYKQSYDLRNKLEFNNLSENYLDEFRRYAKRRRERYLS